MSGEESTEFGSKFAKHVHRVRLAVDSIISQQCGGIAQRNSSCSNPYTNNKDCHNLRIGLDHIGIAVGNPKNCQWEVIAIWERLGNRLNVDTFEQVHDLTDQHLPNLLVKIIDVLTDAGIKL